MPLLIGRNNAPLDSEGTRRALNTFLGFEGKVNVRYEEGERTRFRVTNVADEEIPEIVFGPDIYPGRNVANPNSSLSMEAAAAHEIVHFYRWQSKTELPHGELEEIDEALTSLEAVLRFPRQLNDHDIRQLVEDAIQRLQIYALRRGP